MTGDKGVSRTLRVLISLFSLSVLSQLVHAATDASPTMASSLDDLDFDENGKLRIYHMVYPAHENASHCVQAVAELGEHYRVRYLGLVGDALREVFPDWSRAMAITRIRNVKRHSWSKGRIDRSSASPCRTSAGWRTKKSL